MRRFAPGSLCLSLLGLAVLAGGCQRINRSAGAEDRVSAPPWFVDVTEKAGLHFLHDAGPTGDYFMPQQVGSGAALFDFDGDDRLDIYL
ncbi:MAG TPA: hypothetical protein VH575_27515, partial [Gemmataceae bacterium]